MSSSREKRKVSHRRHLPLKRYRIRAKSPIGTITLIVRARSKKNARFLAMQDYNIQKAEVMEILGFCREEKE